MRSPRGSPPASRSSTLTATMELAIRYRAHHSEDHRPKLPLISRLPFATPSRNIVRLMSVTVTPMCRTDRVQPY